MLIRRPGLERAVRRRLGTFPITAILGPRQCGKTTLARLIATKPGTAYFDLEDPADNAALANPRKGLESLRGLVVLDEIQRRPEVFPVLRVLADRRPIHCRFLILGSASPEMIKGASETLAGRVGFVDMGGFSLAEAGARFPDRLWLRGGMPRSFLSRTELDSQEWREDFIRTFLERDVPQLGTRIPAAALRRFWTMVAHYHGQTWNATEVASSMDVTHPTARAYLDLFTGTFMVRQLHPWFVNVGKRTVKAPKIYLRDSGILHSLLGIRTWKELQSHPKLGASWEGFAMEQILSRAGDRNAYFWATHSGAELDLLLNTGGRTWGFEFKYADAPAMTRSMHIALKDLRLEGLWVVYPGEKEYALDPRARVIPLRGVDAALDTVLGPRHGPGRR